MITRNRLAAVGTTAALVAGSAFFSAAPAQADIDSPACLSAQAEFRAALLAVGADGALTVELTAALDAVLAAQARLDALVDAAALAVIDAQAELDLLLDVLADAELELAGLQAELDLLVEALLEAEGNVADAQGVLDAALIIQAGLIADATETRDDLLEVQIAAALAAEVAQDLFDEALAGGNPVAIAAAQLTLDLALEALDDADDDLLAANVALEALLAVETDAVIAARAALAPLVAIELAAQGLVDELTVVVDLAIEAVADAQADVDAAELALDLAANLEAILDAQADLDAALAVLAGIRIEIDDIDVAADIALLNALFAAAIANCGVAGTDIDIDIIVDVDNDVTVVVGGEVDGDEDGDVVVDGDGDGSGSGDDDDDTLVVTRPGGSGSGSAGGSNRGMNVQSASADDPANLGLGIGGLALAGLVLTAGAIGIRRMQNAS